MQQRAAFLLLLAALACKPDLRGRCTDSSDCRDGASCATTPQGNICVAASGTCTPACGAGQICAANSCIALTPDVKVLVGTGAILSPTSARVTVRIVAAQGLTLEGLSVEVDSADKALATGSIPAAAAGDNLVTLTHFEPGAVGPVSVFAVLTWQQPGGEQNQARSPAVAASIDAQAPAVSLFVPAASDTVAGWVPRTGSNLEVDAQVDDGAGAGAASATLAFDTCPATAPCTYTGTLKSTANTAVTYAFLVPRTAQPAGAEAPLPVTVTALDKAGNQATASGALQIDDKAPVLGAFSLVSQGVTGEDGHTWFLGGQGAPAVEIAVPVSDAGAGLASLLLEMNADDVIGNTTLQVAPLSPDPQAGAIHFKLPAASVRGREGGLHFKLTAADKLGHQTVVPASDTNAIFVDDVPPQVTLLSVDYAHATPARAAVCAQADAAGVFQCGRGGSDHLLRDDSAQISFVVRDCGAGVAAAGPTATAKSGGATHALTPVPAGSAPGTSCAGHQYTAPLNLSEHAPALDAPDSGGTSLVALAVSAQDRVAHAAQASASAKVSVWRWKAKLPAPASGSPALLAGAAAARPVAVGTSTGALAVYGADGSPSWSATLSGIAGDLAVGSAGLLYAVSGDNTCGSSKCGTLSIVVPPTTGSAGTVEACAVSGAGLSASPTITTGGGVELAVAGATSRDGGKDNLYSFTEDTGSCNKQSALYLGANGDLTGSSSNAGQIFFSHGGGFSSISLNGKGFDTATAAATSGAAAAVAPPALTVSGGAVDDALFGSTDEKLRGAHPSTCAIVNCWKIDFASSASSALRTTPVFAAGIVYAADDSGAIFAWDQSTGASKWHQDLGAPVSAPVVLSGGALLAVQQDGTVKVVTQQGALALVQTGSFSGTPVVPAIDRRDLGALPGGVAYVPDGAGWLWAVQLPAAPVAASSTAWPRPGRDSCNSRNAGSTCQ